MPPVLLAEFSLLMFLHNDLITNFRNRKDVLRRKSTKKLAVRQINEAPEYDTRLL